MSTRLYPSRSQISSCYESGKIVPLSLEIPYRDPLELFAGVNASGPAALLDSSNYHSGTATHTLIAFGAVEQIKVEQGNAVEALKSYFSKRPGTRWPKLGHFTGGAVGFLSYEAAHDLDKTGILRPLPAGTPKAWLLVFRNVFVIDEKKKTCRAVTNLMPEIDGPFERAFDKALLRLASMAAIAPKPDRRGERAKVWNFRALTGAERFERMVVKARRYIRAGDIYQANLSQKFGFYYRGDAFKIYRRLRAINPSPFASFIDFGSLKIVSSSPERLIKLKDGWCETRPIAGTRPAGKTQKEAKKLSAELLLNEKERAEHLMLLDLERNDLGRVCEFGSVKVTEMMALERYSHVIHIVSNVVGKLRKDKDRFDLLRAVFPGGTITGCPKIRCMQIIDELERSARGLYTGSIGYLDFNGSMDFNIVIRTVALGNGRGVLQSGAGIVYDSEPRKEYEETLHKAKALMVALGVE